MLIERTGEPSKPDALKVLLLRYLETSDRPVEATASVGSLVAKVWAIESDFWQKHDRYGERFGSRIPFWGCAAFVLGLAAILYLALR